MSIRLLQCLGIANPCYTKYCGVSLTPTGIAVHSTDSPNKTILRYVAPAERQTAGMSDDGSAKSAAEMIAIIGKNKYGNHWNRSGATAAVHAFIGQVADGSLAVCQFLPWTQPCWGSGSGPNGSYNGCLNGKARPPLFIQFEICEGPTSDLNYCKATYEQAVEFAALLIKMFPTITVNNILGHDEIYLQGKSAPRADPDKYWKACGSGYSMASFRAAVQTKLQGEEPADDIYRIQVGAFHNKAYGELFLQDVRRHYPSAFLTKGGAQND